MLHSQAHFGKNFQCEQRTLFLYFNIKDGTRVFIIFSITHCIHKFFKVMEIHAFWRKSSGKEFFGSWLNDVRSFYRGQEALLFCSCECSVVETSSAKPNDLLVNQENNTSKGTKVSQTSEIHKDAQRKVFILFYFSKTHPLAEKRL